ncbi:glycoside hydrolase family 3 protein [Gemmatimonas phototrophica]|uniref:glycoside hydrolase family 3 protein n=1 Tax=Gemmatimonas phototrophica TaxID=1379270 RepID=UPI00047D97FB|nr:glycoside hydrolase family 3 N-terminal domain-containing protein [Gemmatimonas phototrophica]
MAKGWLVPLSTVLAVGCVAAARPRPIPTVSTPGTAAATTSISTSPASPTRGASSRRALSREAWADSVLGALTMRQKVAQMVWVWTLGDYTAVDAPGYLAIEKQISELELGGIIVSVGGPMDIATKVNALQRSAKLPLLVGADLETGAAFRARGGWFLPNAIELGGATSFPYQMGIGATRDPKLAYEMGRVTAQEGRAMGIHMAFAPVLDVNNNPKNPVISARSFGEDASLVAEMGTALVRGIQEHGMLATGKHFPGHGDTEQNSHLELSRVNVSRARLDSVELKPFQAAIDAGLRGMMTFHGDLPALDTTHTAATLSVKVMTDLLRTQMKFNGLLVTDALDMNGVLGGVTMGEATIRAVEAGNDVLLMPTDAKVSIEAVVEAVAKGRLSEARIDASVKKLLMAKHEFGLHTARYVDLEAVRSTVGSAANQAAAREAAAKAITLVRDTLSLVPFKLPRQAKVVSITVSSRVDLSAGRGFDAELRSAFPNLLSLTLTPEVVAEATAGAAAGNAGGYRITPDPTILPASAENALAIARGADVVLVSSYIGAATNTASMVPTQGLPELLTALRDANTKVVLVSFNNPYLQLGLPLTEAHLIAWSPWTSAQRAAARALLGRAPITGKLPITLPGVASFGAGLVR